MPGDASTGMQMVANAIRPLLPPEVEHRLMLLEDGGVRCSCGATKLTYQESIPSTRQLRTVENGVLYFDGMGDEGDGDDTPGVVCGNGGHPTWDSADVSVDFG